MRFRLVDGIMLPPTALRHAQRPPLSFLQDLALPAALEQVISHLLSEDYVSARAKRGEIQGLSGVSANSQANVCSAANTVVSVSHLYSYVSS